MNIFWWRGRDESAQISADEDVERARQDLESSKADLRATKAQTLIHRAIISAAAREVFEVNHLAQTFHRTLRKNHP